MPPMTKAQLRELFMVRPHIPRLSDPTDTLPIIKVSDMDLSDASIDSHSYSTIGYGEPMEKTLAHTLLNTTATTHEIDKMLAKSNTIINNRYQILSPIGIGGASEVYLSQRLLIGDKIALKLLRYSFSTDPETARRFHLEALTTATIKHPNVITIHDFDFTDTGTPYIVMELLHGRTLQGEQHKCGRFTFSQAIPLILPICSALNVAHRQGIVHRDVKPANIVIHHTEDGSVVIKLIDFGIAKQFFEPTIDLKTLPGTVMGTPAYMAPERCMEEPCDGRADIYSLGLILYEMLTGRHPFQAKTMVAMMSRQISENPPALRAFVPELPAVVERVVLKALAKSPNDRYLTALEFADALHNACYAHY